jgi:hypothetical protein
VVDVTGSYRKTTQLQKGQHMRVHVSPFSTLKGTTAWIQREHVAGTVVEQAADSESPMFYSTATLIFGLI